MCEIRVGACAGCCILVLYLSVRWYRSLWWYIVYRFVVVERLLRIVVDPCRLYYGGVVGVMVVYCRSRWVNVVEIKLWFGSVNGGDYDVVM